MGLLKDLAGRIATLTPQQIADSASTPLGRNPVFQDDYLIENLTQIPQIIGKIGEEGSGNCLDFQPGEKKVVELFPDEVKMIEGMHRIFKIKRKVIRRAR